MEALPPFPEAAFRTKLDKLVDTQESIETLSHWVLFHVKHHQAIVASWCDYYFLPNHSLTKLLTLLFLANDVVQNGRRKGIAEYSEAFGPVIAASIGHLYKQLENTANLATSAEEDWIFKVRKRLARLLWIWKERRIFCGQVLEEIDQYVEFLRDEPEHQQDPSFYSAGQTLSHPKEQLDDRAESLQPSPLFLHYNQLAMSMQNNGNPFLEYERFCKSFVGESMQMSSSDKSLLMNIQQRMVDIIHKRQQYVVALDEQKESEGALINEELRLLKDLEMRLV